LIQTWLSVEPLPKL
jgi:hypothetical protein